MAIVSQQYTPGVLTRKRQDGTSETRNWSHLTKHTVKSNRTSGAFVTLQAGVRFRKATRYFHSTAELTGTNGGQMTKFKPDAPVWEYYKSLKTSGWGTDIIFANMQMIGPWGNLYTQAYEPSPPAGMRNEAVTKALLQIADQKVNLGENLATAGQTARLFAGACKNLADFLQHVARDRSVRKYLGKSYRDIRREGVPEFVSRKYLEYVYGWKPLMQDVYSLSKELKEKTASPLLFSGSARSSRQGQGRPSTQYNNGGNNTSTTLGPPTVQMTVRCHLWGQIDPNWAGARSLNQFGLLNPASLAWELMPWSFVVDWLLPVGSVLQALSAPAGLIFVDGSISTKVHVDCPYTNWFNEYDPKWVQSHTECKGTLKQKLYGRDVINSWPLPGLWFDPDPLRGDRSFKALALAISNLSGVRKSTLG